MKKVLSFLLISVCLLSICSFGVNAAEFPSVPVEVNAKAVCLMDAGSGTVLCAKNADEKVYPASVTKIMSLILFTEAIDEGKISLTDTVTVSRNASDKGGSQIWLKEGEQMTVDDLIKATAVASANDACTALGEFIAGSDGAFVDMMNQKAKELGMKNTNFENCTGLDDTADNHYTSAYDVALMSRELLKHDRVLNYTSIWMDTLRGGETQLVNTNKLIKSYDGAFGLKTGTTSRAGCCVSAAAERGDFTLIAVVMGSDSSKDRFDAAKKLLDWGFANYSSAKLECDKSLIADIKVINGYDESFTPVCKDSKSALLKKGEESEIQQKVELPIDVAAPVEKGQTVGYVIFTVADREIGRSALICENGIKEISFFEKYKRTLAKIM